MPENPHVAIIPSPGMGQLIPVVEFAKQLVRHHKFSVTIIIPTSGPPLKAQISILEDLPQNIDHVFLPPVSFDDLGPDINLEVQIFLTVNRSLSFIHEALREMISRVQLVALIVDTFGTDAFEIAREFQVSPYLFFSSNALTLSFCLYLPQLDETVSCEFEDLAEPVQIPGCVPLHGKELLDPVQARFHEAYKSFLHSVKQFYLADGILLNSFLDLEGGAIKALMEEESGRPPIYPIGPLVRTNYSSGKERSECVLWLDNQPTGSVLFISFGSGGTVTHEQIIELALGLEISGKRFLWVVKSPSDKSNSAYFNVQSHTDPFGFLPKGFLERTEKKGLVVSSWVPQAEILSHSSTGGFLTHCGWNSVLESVVHGVPMISWPLYAEQKMTAVMLTEELSIALRPAVNEFGVVGRDEVEKVVNGLMDSDQGEKLGRKMKQLKDAGRNVLDKEGSSMKSLFEFAMKLTDQNNM